MARGAALRDLPRRPRVPGRGRRRRDAARGRRASRSSSRAGRSAAGSRRSTPGTARPRGGSRGRSSKAFSRELPVVCPSGSCATMASHYLPELLGVEPYEVWELSAFLDARGLPAAAAERRAAGRLPRLVPHAPRAADRGRAAPAARALRARSSCRSRGRTSAAGSAGRSRCASPRSRWRWPTTSSPAPARRDALVTADPGCLMHLRGRAEHDGAPVRVVHLATALARGVDA